MPRGRLILESGEFTLRGDDDGAKAPVRCPAPLALRNGRYELREFIGKGGMGAVYRAHDVELDRSVAVKCLLDVTRQGSRALASKEARTLASLSHPNIMRVFDILSAGDAGDQVWIVTEWVEGKCLSELPLPLPPACVLAIMAQVFDALAAAHAAQVIHRDIKPRNVMIGNDGRVTLIDFGVAYAPGLSTGETLVGSLRYTDPRTLEGQPPDAAADLYSAALLAVELLTGETVLPDLAPLPLYRHITRHLRGRLDALLDGAYPPLGALAQRYLGPGRLAAGAEKAAARDAAQLTLAALRKLTPKPPQSYLEGGLCRGLTDDADAARLIAEETAAAVHSPLLSARQKAVWIAFKAEAEARTAPAAGPRPADRPGGGQRRWDKAASSAAATLAGLAALATAFWLHAVPTGAPPAGAAPGPKAANPSAQGATADETPAIGAGAAGRSPVAAADARIGSPRALAPALAGSAAPPAAAATLAKPRAGKAGGSDRPAAHVAVHLVANAWATVTIDGRAVGRLPQAAPFLIAPGRHALRLTNPAVEPLATEIRVDGPSRLRFSLVPKVTPRVFRLARPGRLFIDGRDLGLVTAKVVPLPYGTHEIWVQHGARAGRARNLVLGPDSPGEIRLE